MSYPHLNHFRPCLFDPCVTSGSNPLLTEVTENITIPDRLGLAYGNPKGEGIKLIRSTLATVMPMFLSTGTVFDVIVSAPPEGDTIPNTNIPKPNLKTALKTPGRRLFLMDQTADTPETEMDLGYAIFLVTNALLSPFGEALLIVGAASLKLIEQDAHYSRVWAQNRNRGDGLTELYIARDHRPYPGSGNEILVPRTAIRGSTITIGQTNYISADSKFNLVRDEILRKSNLTGDDFNLFLERNTLRVKFNAYAMEMNPKLKALWFELDAVRGKTLVDLAVMRDTRDKVRGYLKNPLLKVPPGLVTAFDEVCQQMQTLTAPFTRPTPVQRVAWLDEQNGIECRQSFHMFKAGETYPIFTRVIQGRKTEKRHRPGHTVPEDVLVTGQEVLVEVRCEGLAHCFTQFPLTEEMEEYQEFMRPEAHTLSELVQYFKMPEVPDLAESDPTTYLKFVSKLKELET